MSAGRVTGVGGVFLRSANHEQLKAWYAEYLGVGEMFQQQTGDVTVWSMFPADSTYFERDFMVNYTVDDLDALLAKLTAGGVRIDPKREDVDYGRFAWIYDPDGNRIELWEPVVKPS